MHRMAGLAAWLWVALANGFAAADGVVVELRTEASVSQPLVLVRDIALLSGGSLAERNAIGSLDLALLSESTPSASISRRLIEVRMLVAGISPEAVEFIGPGETHVSRAGVVQASTNAIPQDDAPVDPLATMPVSQLTDAQLEDAIALVCSECLGCQPADVEVHLTQPVAAQALRGIEQGDVDFQIVPGSQLGPGANSMQIQFWHGGELIKTAAIRFDLLMHQTVLVLSRFVPRGSVITEEMVIEQRRPITETGFVASLEELEGSETLRDLPAGTLLKGNMLRVARAAQPRPAVRARELVYVTYNNGGLSVSMPDAVAMQDGQPGELIRVMNPTSRRIFSAAVVGPGQVQVQPLP